MAIFILDNVGAIQTGMLPSGDMTVTHSFNDALRAIAEGACRGRGYWDSDYKNWIVKAGCIDAVLADIAKCTRQIA